METKDTTEDILIEKLGNANNKTASSAIVKYSYIITSYDTLINLLSIVSPVFALNSFKYAWLRGGSSGTAIQLAGSAVGQSAAQRNGGKISNATRIDSFTSLIRIKQYIQSLPLSIL